MSAKFGSVIDITDGVAESGATPITSGRVEESGSGTPGEPEEIRGFETFDPASIGVESIGGNPGSGDPPRQRRKRGPNKPKLTTGGTVSEEKIRQGLVNLTEVLMTVHTVGAALLKVEELLLDKSEAAKMADAIENVLKYYPIGVSDKHLAIANLVLTCGGVYGTRVMAYNIRRSQERANKVVPINQHLHGKTVNGFPAHETVSAQPEIKTSEVGMNPAFEPASDEGIN